MVMKILAAINIIGLFAIQKASAPQARFLHPRSATPISGTEGARLTAEFLETATGLKRVFHAIAVKHKI
jgi:hypothetical protein